jgi:hypothetical protein
MARRSNRTRAPREPAVLPWPLEPRAAARAPRSHAAGGGRLTVDAGMGRAA